MDKKVLVDYVKQFEGPKECYEHARKVVYEALEQISANIQCIQNTFQDPNYKPALFLMGIHAIIDVTMNGNNVIEAEFGVVEDESVPTSAESAG